MLKQFSDRPRPAAIRSLWDIFKRTAAAASTQQRSRYLAECPSNTSTARIMIVSVRRSGELVMSVIRALVIVSGIAVAAQLPAADLLGEDPPFKGEIAVIAGDSVPD